MPDLGSARARATQGSRGRYPDLSLHCDVLDDGYHLTVAAAAVTRGLISLFESGNHAAHAEQTPGASASL